jgi:hypothetical protein
VNVPLLDQNRITSIKRMTKPKKPQLSASRPELARLIDTVNLLPPEKVLAEPDFGVSDKFGLFDGYPYVTAQRITGFVKREVVKWSRSTNESLSLKLDNLPLPFRQYIRHTDAAYDYRFNSQNWRFWHQPLDEDVLTNWLDVTRAALRYESFYKLRLQFQTLVSEVEARFKYSAYFDIRTLKLDPQTADRFNAASKPRFRPGAVYLKFPSAAIYQIDSDGVMRVELDEFSRAIHNVDVTRIRRCNKCQKFFWAKRRDQLCCSKSCRNNFNVGKTYEKRRADPVGYQWERVASAEARRLAGVIVKDVGYTEPDIRAYRKEYRRLPQTVINNYLKNVFYKKGSSTYDKTRLDKEVLEPLRAFLTRRKSDG